MCDQLPISVVIPVYNNKDALLKVLRAVYSQSRIPSEIVIVDSSDAVNIRNCLYEFSDRIKINYQKVYKNFPGKARNFGVSVSSQNYIAFLDSKTVPVINWLEDSFSLIDKFDVVFGSVKYVGKSDTQKLICCLMYGNKGIESISGTLISKHIFYEVGLIDEISRAGEDIDWRNRVKDSGNRFLVPTEPNSVYGYISTSALSHLKRLFIYQLHGASLHIQNSSRVFIIGLMLVFLTIVSANWNYVIIDIDSVWFLPHILKIFLVLLAFIVYKLAMSYITSPPEKKDNSVLSLTIFLFILGSFTAIINWNLGVAQWDEESWLFIPHITKVFVVFLFFSWFVVRGLFLPFQRGVKIKYLLPYRWIYCGFFGIISDLVKAPGYLLGSLLTLKRFF